MENKKKGGSILGGLALVLIGIMVLFSNEGRTVSTSSAIHEASDLYTDVESTQIDPTYEGKVIATTGKIDLSGASDVKDVKFGIDMNSVKLKRNVEMYEWEETCSSDDNKKNDCSYDKVWSNILIDSTSFEKAGYNNPTSFRVESEEYLASNVKVGEFLLPSKLISNLSYNEKMNYEKLTQSYKTEVDNFKIDGNYLVNSANPSSPQIGDLRISYEYATDGEVSMLGVQSGNTLKAFTGKKGKSILTIKRGIHTGKELLVSLEKTNKHIKWGLRALGTLAVVLGIGSVFAPLQALTDKIPVLRGIVNTSTGLISLVLGLSISLLVIAIAWFRYRPILSIILIVIIAALLIFLKFKSKNKQKNN